MPGKSRRRAPPVAMVETPMAGQRGWPLLVSLALVAAGLTAAYVLRDRRDGTPLVMVLAGWLLAFAVGNWRAGGPRAVSRMLAEWVPVAVLAVTLAQTPVVGQPTRQVPGVASAGLASGVGLVGTALADTLARPVARWVAGNGKATPPTTTRPKARPR